MEQSLASLVAAPATNLIFHYFPIKRWPPLCGGRMSLKLRSELSARRMAHLESETRRGSAAKAVFSLERSCPKLSMAPVLAIARILLLQLALQRRTIEVDLARE